MDGYVVVPTNDLTSDIALLEANGFLLTTIFPADDPRIAQLFGHGLRVRLDVAAASSAPTLRMTGLSASIELSGGATLVPDDEDFSMGPLDDEFVYVSGGDWGEGRAGMFYRDLIPNRHGGRVIASHIRIDEPGPVPDYVHHHDIRFQMIYCRKGAVEVIYEDQGGSFWMNAGDCVLQPPHIRHRVLASADGCEVVEIASPAEHPTFVEHEIELPTNAVRPDRDFGGQRFSFDRAGDLPWQSACAGWEAQVTGIADATDGLASVRVLRRMGTGPMNNDSRGQAPSVSGVSDGDMCLLFVLEGSAAVHTSGVRQQVATDDSVAVKSEDEWVIDGASADFRCLHITLTGDDT